MIDKLVLIVEDDESLAKAFKLMISPTYRAETVSTLEGAKERVRRSPMPDCIVLDVMLPNGAGMELVNELDKHTPSTPILVVTGYPISEKAVFNAGAQGVLQKPVLSSQLLNSIASVIKDWREGNRISKMDRSMKELEDELGSALRRIRKVNAEKK